MHKIPTQHKVHEGISGANQKKTERAYHITLSEKIKAEIDEVNGGFSPLLPKKNVKQKAKNQENAAKGKVEKFSQKKGYEGFIFKLLEAGSTQNH